MPTKTVGSKVAITNRRGDVLMEDYTGAITVIDVFHKHIHEGEGFIASHRFTGVADDASAEVMIQSGSTKETHVEFNISAGGVFWGDIYLDSTHNHGTSVTPRCLNYSADSTAESIVSYSPTGGADGTNVLDLVVPGSSGPFAVGGQFGSRVEFVLPVDTKMLIKATNKPGGAADVSIKAIWYEHSPSS
jgi:hypothetical protein